MRARERGGGGGGCVLHTSQAMYIKRHDQRRRLVPKASTKGNPGGHFIIADMGLNSFNVSAKTIQSWLFFRLLYCHGGDGSSTKDLDQI